MSGNSCPVFTAVSYTHLDVYKRQGIDGNKFLISNETNFAFSGKCTFFILLTNCKVFLIAYFGLKLICFGCNY